MNTKENESTKVLETFPKEEVMQEATEEVTIEEIQESKKDKKKKKKK